MQPLQSLHDATSNWIHFACSLLETLKAVAASAWHINKPDIFFFMRLLGNSHIAVGGLDHWYYYQSRSSHGLRPSQSLFNSPNCFQFICLWDILVLPSCSLFFYTVKSLFLSLIAAFYLSHFFSFVNSAYPGFLWNNWHCEAKCVTPRLRFIFAPVFFKQAQNKHIQFTTKCLTT